jgi:hypothetical protein
MVKTKKKKQGNSQKDGVVIVSPNAITYHGPTRLLPQPQRVKKDDIVAQLLVYGTLATSVGGVLATVFDDYSQASTSPQWAEYLALYSEYRILSMDLEIVPWNKYNMPITTNLAPIVTVEDRQNATALASYSDACGFSETLLLHEPSTRIRRVVRMQGTGEAEFTSSATSPSTEDRYYLKLYSSGNTASTTIYDYINRLMVQFRNKK